MDEQRLIQKLRTRDEDAFRQLVEAHQQRVFSLIFRMLRDRAEAEDLTQEVFITVFKSIESFRGDARFSTWLYRVATNHAHNRMRFLKRRHHGRQKEIGDTEQSEFQSALSRGPARPDEEFIGRETAGVLQRVFNELEEDHRVVLVLRDLEQLPYDEIAAILEVAEGTVKSRLFRARAKLNRKLKEYQEQ